MDRQTFDRLLLDHLPAAGRLAVRLTGNPHAAEDLVQDAVVKAARGWATYRGDAAFGTWWYRIVVNVWRDRLRKTNAVELADDADVIDDSAERPLEKLAADELAAIVAAAVSRLPARQREVVVLVTYEQLSFAEVAAVLGTNEQNVRTNLSLGRQKLREQLAGYLNEKTNRR